MTQMSIAGLRKKMENDKRQALIDALTETDKILNSFENVVRKDFSRKVRENDFSKIADKILHISDNEKPKEKNEKKDMLKDLSLDQLKEKVQTCKLCKLCKTRKNVVFGEGCTESPLVMVIGEGPGENEDLTARPFVGMAGQFLDKWLKSISLSRETNTYIANIVKCRPPMNRDPELDEKQACFEYLKMQIDILQPKVILCLGKPASTMMTKLYDASITSLRGHFFFYNKSIPMLCTYHPAAVLRDSSLKKAVWDDLQKLAKFLNLDIPSKR